MPKDTTPTFDIQPTKTEGHAPHKALKWTGLIMVIVVVLVVVLSIRQKRAREAYLRTPEGQLTVLQETSAPVTSTPEERAEAMKKLEATNKKQAPKTPAEYQKILQDLQ
jgi:hypothetical protein